VLFVEAIPSLAATGSPVVMHRSDPARTGVYDDGGILPDNSTLWRRPTGWFVESSPAVANGTVYVGSMDFCIYAIGSQGLSPTPTPTSTPKSTPTPIPLEIAFLAIVAAVYFLKLK
jgi:hypothetical protein